MSYFTFKLDSSLDPPSSLAITVNRRLDHSSGVFWAIALTSRFGDFESDSVCSRYNIQWPDWHSFEEWLVAEQTAKAIELRKVQTKDGGDRYLKRLSFMCSQHGTGGKSKYICKNPHWKRKVLGKRTGCRCFL